MTRGDARELAVHLIYSQTFTGEEPDKLVTARLEREYYKKLAEENEIYADRPSRGQLAYIDNVVSGVANRQDELNETIKTYSIGWDLSRIPRLSRSIMQLAIYEILSMPDVPNNVAISEAIRIAKKYDSDETCGFINGILGSFVRSLQTEEKE